ncbi:hypothetical protein LOTGIDRAFT_159556 [Lottia gigantea]|uniref:Uncharacterized protein n=1 Tax=Lottia gigantea TaxID=225164 RepID=V4C5E3_LOTGI|nr:hypothetical protein LOTGIDRAFT_159556 [Lottia gigantea]ESO96814.1 hypothetical protein LOTGIDRAFT_159556 [Lottia gigantea]
MHILLPYLWLGSFENTSWEFEGAMIKKELSSAIRSIVESLNLDWQNPPGLSQLTYQQKELFFQGLYQTNPKFRDLHYLAWNKLDKSQENERSSVAENAELMAWVMNNNFRTRGRYKSYSKEDKLKAIELSEEVGEKSASSELNIPISTIRSWKRNIITKF